MADKTIDYYYTLNSPWAYLGHQRLLAMAKAAAATIAFKLVDYNQVFAQSGGLPLAKRPPQRRAYRLVELDRWRTHLGIKLNPQPKFVPVDPTAANKLVIAATQGGNDPAALSHAIMRAIWEHDRNIADLATLEEIAGTLGLDGKTLLKAGTSPAIEALYQQYTDEAIRATVFGAPWYVYQGVPNWGQERL